MGYESNESVRFRKKSNKIIAIIDYGLGNIRAFANIYKRLNVAISVAKKPEDLKTTDNISTPFLFLWKSEK